MNTRISELVLQIERFKQEKEFELQSLKETNQIRLFCTQKEARIAVLEEENQKFKLLAKDKES